LRREEFLRARKDMEEGDKEDINEHKQPDT